MRLVVFDETTGRIEQCLDIPDILADDALLNIPDGKLALETDMDFREIMYCYVDVDNDDQIVPIGKSPSPYHVFDYTQKDWVDPRTEDDLIIERETRRASTALSRIDFLLAATAAGAISQDDAIAASKGEVPPSMAVIIDSMSPEQQFEAKVRWGAATTIYRNDPFLNSWAIKLGVTPEAMDELFGIRVENSLLR